MATTAPVSASSGTRKGERLKDSAKGDDVRSGNILAAKAIADAIRTSLGPRGMDKMIEDSSGNPIITNDGATILSHMSVFHPTAKMLVELSKSQDIEAGDGTTSVVVLAGSLLQQASNLLLRGVHPTAITESFQLAVAKTEEVLLSMAEEIDLADRDKLIQAAVTSLSSKVVKENSEKLAPLAVDAVLSVAGKDATNVDLRHIRIVKALGGTTDETELIPGMAFLKKVSHVAGATTRVANAKIGLIQFCLSAPKTDMENSITVDNYEAMDRILREERKYILSMCKKIAKTGCNVLLIQKSILRDAFNDLSLHFLSKLKILVVTNIERDDIEFISKTLGCQPVAHVDSFTPDKLGSAGLVEEVTLGSKTKVVKVTEVPNPGHTASVLVRGSNQLVLDETDRSLHDALCVVRALVKRRYLIVGAGAPEVEVAQRLTLWSKELTGMASHCVRAFAEALEVIPYTLAENAGMHPLAIVTELRKRHREGHTYDGINVRRGTICDIRGENVWQPLLVSLSAVSLATETVNMILKIDDMVAVR